MQSSKFIAVIVAVIALVWIGSGFLGTADQPETSATDEASKEQKIMDVRVRAMTAQSYTDDVVVTGRSQASKSVQLKAEIEGQLASLIKEEGDGIEEGEVLATLELRDRSEKVKEARQRLKQREIEFNAAKRLEDKGFNSKVRLAQAQADLETAKAELKRAQVDQTKTNIKAPFDGVIYTQNVEKGDFLGNGDVILQVVDLDPIEFVGFVSERDVQNLTLGAQARVELITGGTLEGEVTYIAPVADINTRTFRIIVSASNEDFKVKEGLTAKIHIPLQERKAHKISPAILSLNDAGKIGVKIVTDQDIVDFVPITILSDKPKEMWISGPPKTTRIITVGQDFVIEGQKVNPVLSDGDGLL